MTSVRRGALSRLVAGGVAGATALAAVTVGFAAPAHAAPVTVSGTLTDPAGNALDGTVEAYAQQPDGSFFFVDSQQVDDGVVSLPVEPGVYKFEFSDRDGAFASEFYVDKPTLETADPVSVAGPVALAPVVLAARPSFTGQVVSPSGRPVESASVAVLDPATGFTVNSALTRPDGTFRVGAPAGTYKIRVSSTNFATEYYDNQPTLEAAAPVTLGAGDVALSTIALQVGTTVTGRVTNAAGAGLERANVSLQSISGGNYYFDSTDEAGNLLLEGVRPGTYKVQFSDPLGEYLGEWWNDKPDFATADVLTVGLGPVGGLDAVLAPDPDNVPVDPATVDLSGQVVDSAGKAVVGAQVVVYDTPAGSDRRRTVATVSTDRTGTYRVTNLDPSFRSEDAFKVYAQDTFDVEKGAYARMPRWFGGAQTYAGASTVGVPTGGAVITLPLTGGIAGAVSSEANLPVYGITVKMFDAKGNPETMSGEAFTEENGSWATTSLVPGTYKVFFSQSGSRAGLSHAPEWYDDATFDKAKTITVRSGQTVTGIDAALGQEFKAVRKPEIRGKQYLGGKLRAYPGVWALESGTTFGYEWLIGDTVVGTGSTYAVTRAAKNKRVTLRVLAENGDFNGTALVATQVIKKKPKVKVAVKGSKATIAVSAKKVKAKKFKGSVVVRKIVREDEYGAPVYKKIGKARLRNGKAALTLKKLAKGKNKLVFEITLKGGKYGNAEVTRTVKLKR